MGRGWWCVRSRREGGGGLVGWVLRGSRGGVGEGLVEVGRGMRYWWWW
jgi:hypothetical protein